MARLRRAVFLMGNAARREGASAGCRVWGEKGETVGCCRFAPAAAVLWRMPGHGFLAFGKTSHSSPKGWGYSYTNIITHTRKEGGDRV
jgi:hypothetical protein